MKVVALISGGKDSCYNMQLCESFGHEIVALANLLPLDDAVDELDSFMFQTVGHQVVAAYAQCMGLPLFRRRIMGSPRAKNLRYSATDGDEVEDLEVLLRAVKSRVPDLGGVSSGAIASDYQRLRVENVCSSGLQAVLVKVAAMGLDPHKHLGKDLVTLQPVFLKLQNLYGCNVCGEGGEYESLVLDCPLFKINSWLRHACIKEFRSVSEIQELLSRTAGELIADDFWLNLDQNAKIILDEFTVQLHSPDTIAPVGVLHPTKFHLEYKSLEPDPGLTELPLEVTDDFVANRYSNETHAARLQSSLNSTGLMPCQETSLKSKLFTNITRQRHGFVAMSCGRNGDPNQDTESELGVLLSAIEKNLEMEKLSWADVLYVHLYLNDMKEFSKANAIYTQHITEKESVRGVPSRCCVELPLVQAGMGRVLLEILASTDQSKKVLHVQSISSWAPCCIGPYSQATQHQQLMYMAGQLGFDPPTMNLVEGGATCEMTHALKHCGAIGEVFTLPFSNSVLSYTVYCSSSTGVKGMHDIEGELSKYLSNENLLETKSQSYMLPKPLVLYVLLPTLPKGALVEVAPLTYMSGSSQLNYDDSYEEADTASWELISKNSRADVGSEVEEFSSCKAIILPGHLCRSFTFLSYRENSTEAETLSTFPNGHVTLTKTFELISSVLAEAALSWTDVFVLRVYFVAEKISANILGEALGALVEDSVFKDVPEPTLIPVVGVGDTAELQDLIAVELTASGGS